MTFWIVYAIRVLIGDSTSAWLQMLIRIVKQVTPTRKQSAWLNASSSTSSTDWMCSSSRKKSGFSPFVCAAKKTCWSKKTKTKTKIKELWYFMENNIWLYRWLRNSFYSDPHLLRERNFLEKNLLHIHVCSFFSLTPEFNIIEHLPKFSLSFYNCVRMFVF